MHLPHLVTTIAIGVIAGWLAGLVTRGRGLGLIGNILVALPSAFVGVYLIAGDGLRTGLAETALAAFLSAFAVLALIGWIRR